MFKRYALVSARPESIAAYLPDNYRVIGSVDGVRDSVSSARRRRRQARGVRIAPGPGTLHRAG